MSDMQPATNIKPLPRGEKVGQSLSLYAGRVMPQSFGELIEFAQMMCKGGVALPTHLRDNPGSCMRLIQQSIAWEMDPWAVASKTYAVNDQLAYEAQMIAAVIKKWAPIKQKVIPYVYTGEGESLVCSITVHHAETGEAIVYESPKVKDITVKNSPLWKSDPRQQLGYYSIRALARRHFPEILMGVYDREEVLAMKDITPPAEVKNFLNDPEHPEDENQDPPQDGEVIPPAKAQGVDMAKPGSDTTVIAEFDPVTGEILRQEDITPEPITPDLIAKNFMNTIASETSAKALRAWFKDCKKDIDALPEGLRASVTKAYSAKELELDEF